MSGKTSAPQSRWSSGRTLVALAALIPVAGTGAVAFLGTTPASATPGRAATNASPFQPSVTPPSHGNGIVELSWGSSDSQTFSYRGSQQTMTVPAGVTTIEATAVGGSGGNSSLGMGGTGSSETGTIGVIPGETLYVYVGGRGQDASDSPCGEDAEANASGGYNGGGQAGYGSWGASSGAGGGGASDVQTLPQSRGITSTRSSWLIGAGGGGGAGGSGRIKCSDVAAGGQGGSGTAGAAGGYEYVSSLPGGGGAAATSSANGLGGAIGSSPNGSDGVTGVSGENGPGGQGGWAAYDSSYGPNAGGDVGGGGGGGGGGGYWGGGGGASGGYFQCSPTATPPWTPCEPVAPGEDAGGGGGGGAGSSHLAPVPVPELSVGGVTVDAKPDSSTKARFPVTLSSQSSKTVTVTVKTADDTAKAGTDYEAVKTIVTFDPGDTKVDVPVTVLADPKTGRPLDFTVTLTGAVNAPIASGEATGIINRSPIASVPDLTVTRPYTKTSTADVKVSLNRSATQTVTLDYTTADDTATAGKDYESASGALTFPAGKTTESIPVRLLVNPDAPPATDEDFTVTISNPDPDWVVLSHATGTVTLTTKVAVSSMTPESGTPVGGQRITITGTGFGAPGSDDASVLFCRHPTADGCPDASLTGTSVTVLSETRLKVTTPAWDDTTLKAMEPSGSPVGVEVVVTPTSGSPQESDPTTATYTYKIVVTSITTDGGASSGTPFGGLHLIVRGSGFGPANVGTQAFVQLCNLFNTKGRCAATGTDYAWTDAEGTVENDTTIDVTEPPLGGEHDATMFGPKGVKMGTELTLGWSAGSTETDSDTATFTFAANASKIMPDSGGYLGGEHITIHGMGFGFGDYPVSTVLQFCTTQGRGSPCLATGGSFYDAIGTITSDRTLTATTPKVHRVHISNDYGVTVRFFDDPNHGYPIEFLTDLLPYVYTCGRETC